MIAFVNNHFIEEEKATLQVGDLALHRGYAVFDFLRTSNHVPLFLDDYLDRFFNSALQLRLRPLQSRTQIKALIYELIGKNNLAESGIKILLTGGYSPESYEPVSPNLIILQQKITTITPERFTTGIKAITHQYQRDLPAVKSINYLMGVWLQQKIRDNQADDVLYYNNLGAVSEFPRSNVFMVTQDQTIVTPDAAILHGITRKKLLELTAKKYKVELRTVNIEEIKNAAEVFMTSTTKRLLPVTKLDEVVIGNGKAGPVTILLHNAFIEMENGILLKHNQPQYYQV